VLHKNPLAKIEIQGGTDNIGPEDYNRALSQKRAQNAKSYLIKKGIESDRITAVGFGTARNKASNENSTGRALNRRIDFAVIE
jgi:OOP family OmpA-OmpF porin